MKSLLSAMASAAAIVAGLLGVVVAAPTASATGGVSELSTCPAVAIVAARGSEQGKEYGEVAYSPTRTWVSNGYESVNLSGLFTQAADQYRERTGGDLFANVPVIALDAEHYPASLPLPRLVDDGEEIDPLELSSRSYDLFSKRSPVEIGVTATSALIDSVRVGVERGPGQIEEFEATTGCHPRYIFTGFSQGVVVMTALERQYAAEGRLFGSFYLGNPLLKAGDASVVGTTVRLGGLVHQLAPLWPAAQQVEHRLNYCAPNDIVCDLAPSKLIGTAAGEDDHHAQYYYGGPNSQYDKQVADTLAQWILAAQGIAHA